jgi:hypothetical protein
MPPRRSKHDASAEKYESWPQERIEAELARYGYRWENPPEPMSIGGRPVSKILVADSFTVLVYLGPMLYWRYKVVGNGAPYDHWYPHSNGVLVRGGPGKVMFAASAAALYEIDRVVERASGALRD